MSGRAESSATKEEIQAGQVGDTTPVGQFSGLVFGGAPVNGVDEVQTLTISGSPTGGTFTVTYNGVTTAPIAHNASAATLQTALQALSSIGTGNATVSGSAGGPYTVTFVGELAGKPIGAVSVAHSFSGGSTPDIASEVTTPGVTGTFRGTAAPGAMLHRNDGTPGAYINKGLTIYKPSWKLITTAA